MQCGNAQKDMHLTSIPTVLMILVILADGLYGQMLGCYQVDPNDGEFTRVAPNYSPVELTAELCVTRCTEDLQKYAALTGGTLCLCGASYDHLLPSNASDCHLPCPDGINLTITTNTTCGGHGYSAIYQSPQPVLGLRLVLPDVVEAFQHQSVNVSKSWGNVSHFRFRFDDVTPDIMTSEAHTDHVFYEGRTHQLSVTATDLSGKDTTVDVIQTVESRIRGFRLQCPEASKVGAEFVCNLTFNLGSNLKVEVDVRDGAIITLYPPDAQVTTYGSVLPDAGSLPVHQQTTFFLLNDVITTSGQLQAVDVHTDGPGKVILEIYRPMCPGGEYFCYQTLNCTSNTSTCTQHPDIWATTCSSQDTVYVLDTHQCVYTATGQGIPASSVYDVINRTSPISWNLTKVGAVTLELGGAGVNQQVLGEDEVVEVEAGDLVRVVDADSVVTRQVAPLGWELTLPAQTLSESPIDLSAATRLPVRHLMRLLVVRQSKIQFSHTYTRGLYEYNVTSQATNGLPGGASSWSIMDVQAVIDHIQFDVKPAAVTNTTLEIVVGRHTGSKVTYYWDFGDGQTLNTTYKNLTHTYTDPGVYCIHLQAVNEVSTKETSVVVTVQDPLQNLQATAPTPATVYGTRALLQWNITQGTNVSYFITLGDGNDVYLAKDNISSQVDANITDLDGVLAYTYMTPGNFSISVNASNLVSSAEVVVYLPVQKIITNFRVMSKQPVAWREAFMMTLKMDNGSHLTLNASLNDIQITNISMGDNSIEGAVYIQSDDYLDIGLHTFAITVGNLVTAPHTITTYVWLEYILTNVTLIADQLFIIPNTIVNFNLTMMLGSRYNISSDYGDNTTEAIRQVERTMFGDVEVFFHTFTEVMNCSVLFSLVNDVSEAKAELVVTVQNPVKDFIMNATSPLQLVSDGNGGMRPVTVNSILVFAPSLVGIEPPTDAFYYYDFKDGSSSTFWNYLVLPADNLIESCYTYTAVGSYNVTVNISNFVSFRVLHQVVQVDQPIVMNEQELNSSLEKANVSQAIEVTVPLDWGSRVHVRWVWGDSKINESDVSDYRDEIKMSHEYGEPFETVTLTVTLTNSIGSINLAKSFIIEYPVLADGTSLHCESGNSLYLYKREGWSAPYPCEIYVNGPPYPSNAKYSADFGDSNPNITNRDFNKDPTKRRKRSATTTLYLSFSHDYTKGKDYVIKLQIWNNVSSIALNQHVTVTEALDSLQITIEAIVNGTNETYPHNEKSKDHLNYFAMEDTIVLTVLQSHGTHTMYTWSMGDGEPDSITTDQEFQYKYMKPGHFYVELHAANVASNTTLNTTLHIQRSIYDIAISCPQPLPVNYTFTFSIDFGSIGSEACYRINFVETTPDFAEPETRIQLYGNKSQCEQDYRNDSGAHFIKKLNAEDIEANRSAGIANGNMTIDFTYWVTGVNIIELKASNIVTGTKCSYWRMVVTRGVCYDPVMDLRKANPCLESMCNNHSYPKAQPKEVPQNFRSTILAVRTDVRPNCTSTQIMAYQWTIHRVNTTNMENEDELTDAELPGVVTTSRELRIKYRILPYGLYRFTLNASMDGEIGIENVDSVEYEIIKTPLKGNIVGGREARYKWNSTVDIDAQNQTTDPDADPNNQTGMTFYWYCKKWCEQWPIFTKNKTEVLNNSLPDVCEVPENGKDDGGCNYADGMIGPGVFVNTTEGNIQFGSTHMYENRTYEVLVVVWKDTRSIELTQYVTIVNGDPPRAKLHCVTNCDVRYNPKDRFSVQMVISGSNAVDYSFSWELYKETPNMQNSLARAEQQKQKGWRMYVTTKETSENLALEPSYFKGNEDTNDLYYFLLKVWRSHGDSSNFGQTYFAAINIIIPRGEAPDGKVDIKIRCTDRIGSYSETLLALSPDPMPPPTPAPTLAPGMGMEDPNVEAKNVENILSSDPASAPECGITLALNMPMAHMHPMSSNTSTTTHAMTTALDEETITVDPVAVFKEKLEKQAEQQKMNKEIAASKASMATTLSEVIPTDLSQANIIAATVSFILQDPDQNNFNTLDAALHTGDKIIALIEESIGSQEATAGQIDEASRSCLCLYSPLLMTANKMVSDCHHVQGIDLSEYKQDASIVNTVREQQKVCNETLTKIEVIIDECQKRMTDLGDKLMEIKVNSESPTVFGCGNVTMNADRRFSDGINKTKFATGRNNFKFPNDLSSFFGVNNTAYAYEVQTKVVHENIYNFANDSLNVSTPVIFFNLKNNSDGSCDVDDADTELAITLTRSPGAEGTETMHIPDSPDPVYHTVDVMPNSALIVRVKTVINDTDDYNSTLTTVPTTESLLTTARSSAVEDEVQDFPENVTKEWKVYIREDKRPDITSTSGYEFNCSLPLSSSDVRELRERTGLEPDDTDLPDMYTCFVPAEEMNRTYTAKYYIAIVKLTPPTEAMKSRKKRSIPDDSGEAEPEPPATSGSLELRTTRCVWWDKTSSQWSTDGCRAGPMTKGTSQQCLCKRTGTFAAEFVVPINLPDFSKPPFSGLESNPLVFCVMQSFLCLYAVCLIWARRKDRDDELLAGASPLLDNNPRNKYLYELVVYTGNRRGAGTTARVRFVLVGDQSETKPRLLSDNKRPCLKRGNVDVFVMAVPRCLGHLTHLRIWHDNSGGDPSWFFSRLQVVDLQTQQQVFFMVDRWLAVEEDDGMIERILPTAGSGELVGFQHLFFTKTRKNLSDSHLWFSVLQRPVRSRFTRVQRLTCCLVLLFTSMTSSIMFYGSDEKQTDSKVITLGPITVTTTQILVGVFSSLIAIPFSVIVVTLFRYAGTKPPKDDKTWAPTTTSKPQTANKPVSSSNKPVSSSQVVLSPPPTPRPSSMTDVESPDDIGLAFIDREPVTGIPRVVHVQPEVAAQPNKMAAKSTLVPQKKKFALPYWCVHVGYVVSFLVVCIAFYFTVNISLTFGEKLSQDWLISFVVSFFESVFLSQPLKVFVLAMAYALIIRKPDTEEEVEGDKMGLGQDEEWVHSPPTGGSLSDVGGEGADSVQPLDPELVKAAREIRFKELKMSQVITEIVAYLFFLALLMVVAYGNRSPHSYNMYFDHKSALVDGDHGNKSFALKKVSTREKVWQFGHEVLLPTMYVTHVYNNRTADWSKGYLADHQNYIMGEPRLRLLRARPEACPPPLHLFETVCRPSYSMFDQDEAVYKKGWIPVNQSDPSDKNDTMWSYRSRQTLDGYPYMGQYATYSGGGYVANLGLQAESATTAMKELIEHGWLDRHTRVLFLEFLVYNANVNLFGACMIAIEFLETGGIHPTFKFFILRLNPYVGPQAYVNIITELLVLLFILYFIFREIKKVRRERKAYFKSLANWFEVLVLALSVGTIVMFFYRLFISRRMAEQVSSEPNKYHNFDYVVVWHEAFGYLLALVIGLSTIKFIRVLRFNKKMSMLSATLRYSLGPMFQFLCMFMVAFLAFVFMAYYIFGPYLVGYSTFVKTLQTMFSVMLNKFDYYSLVETNRVFGPLLLFTFTIAVGIILVNMFISVVIEAFATVKYDISKQTNDYEIVEFIVGRMKGLLGMEDRKKLQEALSDASVRMNTRYKEGGPAEDLRMRIELLLQVVDSYVILNSDKADLTEEILEVEQKKKTKTLYISS